MTEEGDNPTVSGKVQSTSMESLNDELTPKTTEPLQEIKESKEESIPTRFMHRVGSFITKSSKTKALQLELENQLEKMAEMECEIKAKSDVIVLLNKKLDDETDDLNKKLDSLVMKLEDEAKSNSAAIKILELTHQNTLLEKESLITKMECEAKLRSKDNEDLKSETEKLNVELDASREEIDRFKRELKAKGAEFDQYKSECESEKKSLMTEMESEAKKKLEVIELLKLTHQKTVLEKESLIRKMEDAAKLKDQEMENLKIAHSKAEIEWKSAKVQLEDEIKSKAKEIDNLEGKSASLKRESDDLNKKLEASRNEIDRCKRESDEKITDMENDNKLKTNKIEYLQRELEAKGAEFDKHKLECESEKKSLMTEMESEAKKKLEEIELLKKSESESMSRISELVNDNEFKSRELESKADAIDSLKKESTEKIANMENEIKLKTEHIESLQKESIEKTSRMSEMEKEIKSKADEVESLQSRISQLEDEANSTNIGTNLKNPHATIHAKFPGISNLKIYESVYSQPTEFDGITWRMRVQNGDSFDFHLFAEKENADDWYCPVIAELRLISQKSQEIVRRKETKLIYGADEHIGCIESISFKDLFDSEKGYVKDDLIIIAVAFRASPRNIAEATKISLRAQFYEISNLTDALVYSDPTEVDGITWKMSVFKDINDYIEVRLDAEKKNAVEWWCPVIVDLHLVSQQKSGEIGHIQRKKVVYDKDTSSSYILWISCKDLFNEENGYVKDDSIIVVMNITVLPIN